MSQRICHPCLCIPGESGVLGPLTNRQPFGVVRFRGYFMTPPTISLALSDLTQVDATKLMNFAVRGPNMTLEKLPFECQKMPKSCHFLKNNCQKLSFSKKIKYLAIF